MYVDVHTHLTHRRFKEDLETVIEDIKTKGITSVVVNGLDPKSNRQILDLAAAHSHIKASLGMYPIDACCQILPADFKLPFEKFDVDQEIAFISESARSAEVIAIGEIGLDGYWLNSETYETQEYAFKKLAQVAIREDIPAIVHSRKMEKRCFELLEEIDAKKVVFHCYGGKTKLAITMAEQHPDWCFSIPANATRNQAFQKLLKDLPEKNVLTETDAPFLSPIPGKRNDPSQVIGTVNYWAELKGWEKNQAQNTIWQNYLRLFSRH